jgi:hypothetical protein
MERLCQFVAICTAIDANSATSMVCGYENSFNVEVRSLKTLGSVQEEQKADLSQ